MAAWPSMRARIRRQRERGDPGAIPGGVQRVGDHDVDVATKTTLEGVVARDGRDLSIPVVVQTDRDDVVAGLDGGGDAAMDASLSAHSGETGSTAVDLFRLEPVFANHALRVPDGPCHEGILRRT
jgi:hypothetical protein